MLASIFPLSDATWLALWFAGLFVGHLVACRCERARLGHPDGDGEVRS